MRSALLAVSLFLALTLAASDARVFPEWGFRIAPPDDGWAVLEEAGAEGEPGFTLKLYPKGTSGEIMTQVTAAPTPHSDPLQAVEESRAFVAGKGEYTEFTVIEEAVAGRAAPGFTVRYATPEGEFRLRQLFLIEAEAEGRIRYTIQSHAPAARFAEFEPAFRSAIASFAFVPVEKPAPTDATRLRDLAARCGSEIDWAPSFFAAALRARSERKPVLVVVRAYPGFTIADDTKTELFMDPDVVDLVRERFVACRFTPGDAAPFAEPDSPYGLSGTTFGQALLVVSPDGRVLEETPSLHETAAFEFLLRALERHPDFPGPPIPESVAGLARAEIFARRGEPALAESLLAGDDSAAAHRLRASIHRRARRGAAALESIAKARAAAPREAAFAAALDLEEARVHLRLGDAAAARARLASVLEAEPENEEALYGLGLLDFRASGSSAARAAWSRLALRHPESRWAWKAAADMTSARFAAGLAPDTAWPDASLLALFEFRERAPLEPARIAEAERDGVSYLLRSQGADGSWIGPFALESAGADVPDPLGDAVTSIAGSAALRRAASTPGAREAAARALERSLVRHERGPLASGVMYMDYRPWSRSFFLFFLADALEAGLGDRARLRAAATAVVADLEGTRNSTGGWTYYVTGDVASGESTPDHAMSFVTAAAALALVRARDAGLASVPEELVSGALDCLERMRRSDGVFEYMSFADRSRAVAPTGLRGAAGRGPVCELALLRGGRSSAARLEKALDSFVDDRADLEKQLGKALMHAGPEAEGCHYLLFDYAFAASALRELPPERRKRARAAITSFVLRARRVDGSFLDTPILGPACGTGLALWAIDALREEPAAPR